MSTKVSITVDGVSLISGDDFTMYGGAPKFRIPLTYGAKINVTIHASGSIISEGGVSDGSHFVPWWAPRLLKETS